MSRVDTRRLIMTEQSKIDVVAGTGYSRSRTLILSLLKTSGKLNYKVVSLHVIISLGVLLKRLEAIETKSTTFLNARDMTDCMV